MANRKRPVCNYDDMLKMICFYSPPPHRYRNMCRFNSGVRPFPFSATLILKIYPVLLSPWTSEAVPILLEVSSRSYFPLSAVSDSPSGWSESRRPSDDTTVLPMKHSDQISNSSAISTMIHSWSCKTKIRCMVGIPQAFSFCIFSHLVWIGFTVSLYEYEATIPTLWKAVKGHFSGLFLCHHTYTMTRIHPSKSRTGFTR